MNNFHAVPQNYGTVVVAHNKNNTLFNPVIPKANLSQSLNLRQSNNLSINKKKDISKKRKSLYLIDNELFGLISSKNL